jgi:hypothetical protein
MTTSDREGKAYGFFWYGGPVENVAREVSSIEGMDHLPANLTLNTSTLDTFLERAELDAGLRNVGGLARGAKLNIVVEAKTHVQAYKRLIDAISGYVGAVKQENLSDDIVRGVLDKEYETMWRRGMAMHERYSTTRRTSKGPAVPSPSHVGFQLVC